MGFRFRVSFANDPVGDQPALPERITSRRFVLRDMLCLWNRMDEAAWFRRVPDRAAEEGDPLELDLMTGRQGIMRTLRWGSARFGFAKCGR